MCDPHVRSRSHYLRIPIVNLVVCQICVAANNLMSDAIEVKLSKKERKNIVVKISNASGIAQYAIEAKMSDFDLIEAANYLEILSLTKSATNYNRFCQAQKTYEANNKLRQFIALNNSEIYKLGKWLIASLSKTGKERQDALLEQNIVHKDDYNKAVIEMGNTITDMDVGQKEQARQASNTIKILENTNNELRYQLEQVKIAIIKKHGTNEWQNIIEINKRNIRR